MTEVKYIHACIHIIIYVYTYVYICIYMHIHTYEVKILYQDSLVISNKNGFWLT